MATARLLAAWVVTLQVLTVAPTRAQAQPESADALRAKATASIYEHNHDEAIRLLRQAVAAAPDQSATHRSLASALWLKMLFQRGAVTVDHYLGSFNRSNVDLPKPAAELVTEFQKSIASAITIAEAQVKARPKDPQAHYDLGAALGLNASYIASIEGKLLAGFRAASRAYDEHEKVLQLDPSRKDAGLTIGTYRYIVSTLSVPLRLMAYVAGFGGGKERGIQMLQQTAATPGETRTDAMFALVLVYNREKRYDDALRTLQELRTLHPRNRLVLLEAGSTALRAGKPAEAERFLNEGLGMLAATTGAKIPGEETLWRYKRGAALVALGKTDAARSDLQQATTANAQTWVQGRARVELARVALKDGNRTAAADEARQAESLCQRGHDPVCLDEAKKLLRTTDGR